MYPHGPPYYPWQFYPPPRRKRRADPPPDPISLMMRWDRYNEVKERKRREEEEKKKKQSKPPEGGITLEGLLSLYAKLVAFGLPIGLLTLYAMNQLLNMVASVIKVSVN